MNQQDKKIMQIEIDEDIYAYLATQTESIGESASSILRRLLHLEQPKEMTNSSHSSTSIVHSSGKNNILKKTVHLDKKQNSTQKTNADKRTTVPVDEVSSLIQMLNSDEFLNETKSVNRFLMILEKLYQSNAELFAHAANCSHGSKRIYIAKDQKRLMNSGSNTKPKLINHSPYWVITNNNTQRKALIIANIMEQMGFEKGMIQFTQHQFSPVE